MKDFLRKLNEWGKEYNGFFVLLPIIITITVGILKFWCLLFTVGVNFYNGMPLLCKTPFILDNLAQIFVFLVVAIVCILTNLYCYYVIKNNNKLNIIKKLGKFFIIVFILVLSFFVFTGDIPAKQIVGIILKKQIKQFLLLYITVLWMLGFFGVFIGFSYKENTVLSNVNEKLSEKTFGLIKKHPKSICNLIITILGILLFFSPFWLGKAFAEDNKSYYVIENENLVIMADGDENYLCHSFIEKNNIIYFDTSKIIPCAKDKAIIAKKFDKNIRGGAKIAETSENIQVPTNETSSETLK